jgi:hypothetical protein
MDRLDLRHVPNVRDRGDGMSVQLIGIGTWMLASIPPKLSSVVVAVGCALAIVACGTSGTGRSATRSGGFAQAVSYSDCMRSHGVPDFPDPTAGGGFDLSSKIDTQAPAYLSARQSCTKLLPGPGAPHTLSERQQLQFIAAAKCMRTHGVQVTDPTFNGPYITLDVPDQTTIGSPAFKRAEPACHYFVPKNPTGSSASP